MENTNQSVSQGVQTSLPNSTAVLVLGILSIAVCWCYGLFGLAMGIIALVLSSKAKTVYNANSEAYTLSSFKNLSAGRVCAIIGTVLSSLYVVFVLIWVLIFGAALSALFTQFPWESI